jgi:hypothetical protein
VCNLFFQQFGRVRIVLKSLMLKRDLRHHDKPLCRVAHVGIFARICIINRQSRTTDKGWSNFVWGVGVGFGIINSLL